MGVLASELDAFEGPLLYGWELSVRVEGGCKCK